MYVLLQAVSRAKPEKQAEFTEDKRWYKFLLSPLWLCLLIALGVRIFLIIHSQNFLDGDEALVGIQAQHILRGEFPIYYYNQPYMGSLEAYLTAILFALFGASPWVMRLEAALLSLAIVWLTWKLAGALADTAKISGSQRRTFMTIAALFAAFPSLYDGVTEIRMLGGYIETFVIMLILLLSAYRLTQRWSAGATYRELIWRWAGIGFTAGLGFWVDPLVLSAVLAAGLWILGNAALIIYRNFQEHFRENRLSLAALFKPFKNLLPAIVALPAALLGFAPGLIWGMQNNWNNVTYVLTLGGGSTQRLDSIRKVAKTYVTCLGPRMISGSIPGESQSGSMPFLFLLIIGGSCIFGSIILLLFSMYRKYPQLQQASKLVILPLLFGICTAVSFCVGKTAVFATIACNYDPVGRYAAPLLLALPFFYATIFALLFHLLGQKRTHSVEQSTASTITPNPYLYARIAKSVLFVLLCCFLITQAFTYQQSNIVRDLQSSYCHQEPIDYTPIIHYLESQHIHYAWSDNWISYPIVLESNEQVIVTDAEPFISPPVTLDRLLSNTVAVRHADRPSLIVLVGKNDSHPSLLQELDATGITYKTARFPAVPDTDVLIVTPLNRTILPFASKAIASNFVSCSE